MVFNDAVESVSGRAAAHEVEAQRGAGRLEADVLPATKAGNRSVDLEELCRSHAKKLLNVTYRITRNREDAEDALQDSFLRALVHLRDFDGRSSASTWLTSIAINSALMILRKKGSARKVSIDDAGTDDGHAEFDSLVDHRPTPEDQYIQREREGFLRASIHSLPPRMRRAIELQRLQELSMMETAEIMGISVSNTKSKVSRAKSTIRKSLKPKFIRKSRSANGMRLLPAA